MKMISNLKKSFIIITLSTLLLSSYALAVNWTEWDSDDIKKYPEDKIWTIDFSIDVDSDSISDSNIYVLDSDDNIFPTDKVIKDSDSIEVRPISSYNEGNIYRLFISDELLSASGNNLKTAVYKKFEIEQNTPITFESEVQNALRIGIEELDVTKYEVNRFEFVDKINSIVRSDPTILYYDGLSYSYNTSTDLVKTIKFKYKITPSEIESRRNEVIKKADEILDSLNLDGKNEYEKIKIVHDHIVKNTVYDSEGFDNDSVQPNQYSMYGTLIENSAVCEGYAETFLYFMDKLNIECQQVFGTANGNNHAWNLVKVDGLWYQIDLTFDDPVPDTGDNIKHIYMLINDDKMGINHIWNKGEYIETTSLDSYYYRVENLEATSESEFKSLLKSLYSEGNKSIEIWCSNFNSKSYDKELIKQALSEMNYYGSFSYSINSDFEIISVNLK
jgi:hypothetical protein